jgi:hypothetical protein
VLSKTGKPTGNRSLRRPRRRLEDSIKVDLEEIGVSTKNWVGITEELL